MVARVEIRPSGAFSAISAAILRGGAHLILRHQHVGKTHGERFLAGDAAAGVEHHRGVGLADHLGQRRGQAEARMEAEPREVRAEARLRTGDAEVRHHREPEPAADRRAMDRADDRLRERNSRTACM